MELDLDRMLEVLDARMVRTKAGSYVSVEDLKTVAEEFRAMKEADRPTGEAKTLAGASKALLKDPEFLKQFEGKPPRPPADAGVVKPVTQEV